MTRPLYSQCSRGQGVTGNASGMLLADKSQAYRVLAGQSLATLLAALALLALGLVYAWSGLIGGMIAVLANAVFAAGVFARYRAQEPAKLLGRFYRAELQKLVLTGFLFAGVFIWITPLSAGALFGVYLLVQLVPMLVSHFLD